jgi:hypothetical protein
MIILEINYLKLIFFTINTIHYLIIRMNYFQIKQIFAQNYQSNKAFNNNFNKIIQIFVN